MYEIKTGRELATGRKIAIKKLKVGQFKGEEGIDLSLHLASVFARADCKMLLRTRWTRHVCYSRSQILTRTTTS